MKNKLARIIIFIGICEILSSIIIHPLVAQYWRNADILNYYDVMIHYSFIAIIIGIITISLGLFLLNSASEVAINLSLFFLVISIVIISDRLLLAKYGLGLWKYDDALHFVHRPNLTFSWGEDFDNKLIKINSHGFHDNEFLEKLDHEKRIFMLGNSITMGHGVTRDETFSNQLEALIPNCNLNVLNLAVQGYSSFQELEVLKRSLLLKPDMVISAFCLNDITEPVLVNRDQGGRGYDYHKIFQAGNNLLGYLLNETGYGKLISNLKFKDDLRNAKTKEMKQILNLTNNPFYNEKIASSWEHNLNSLYEIKIITHSLNIPFLVLIFPYTFQLNNSESKKPQDYLIRKLNDMQIDYLDFCEHFEFMLNNNTKPNTNKESMVKKFFLDENHLTVEGHKFVATKLKETVLQNINLNCLE